MTVSTTDRLPLRRLALTTAIAAAAFVAADAVAQTRGPIPLTPQVLTPPAAPKADLGPKTAEPPSRPALPSTVANVEVQPLQALDANSVGVLHPGNGGLGADMWAGTGMGLVQRLLPHLPAATPSPTARDLARRLLLSEAAVPAGEKWGDKSLLQLRIERLAAMGDLDGALALLDAVPTPAVTPPLRRAWADALLLAGKDKEACEQANMAGDDDGTAKLRVYCQIQAGKAADAQLGVAMLRETGQADPAFFALADELLGSPTNRKAGLPAPTPLLLAMMRAAGKPLPADVAASEQPAVLKAVAEREGTPDDIRLATAEKAARLGALDGSRLAALYQAVIFKDADKTRQPAEVAADASPRSHALLYQLARSQAAPAAQAEAIERALTAARMRGDYLSTACAYAPLAVAIEPGPQLASFAPTAFHLLLAAGDVVNAARWLPYVEPRPEGVAILARLAGIAGADAPTPAALAAWRGRLAALPQPQADRRMAIVFGLLSALGDEVPADAWVPLMAGPPLTSATIPQPALWHALPAAAAAGRRAETALLALVSLGETGPAGAEPTTLYRVVAALKAAGFDAEARGLAVEAAIANGV